MAAVDLTGRARLTHDVTAARTHVLPAPYRVWSTDQLPTLADKGYTGTGTGVRVPVRRPGGHQVLDATTRAWNSYINA